jgi:hypothetical protein
MIFYLPSFDVDWVREISKERKRLNEALRLSIAASELEIEILSLRQLSEALRFETSSLLRQSGGAS